MAKENTYELKGTIACNRFVDESKLNTIIKFAREQDINLEQKGYIFQESDVCNWTIIQQIAWISFYFLGTSLGQWVINKTYDGIWEKIKKLYKFSKDKQEITPQLNLKYINNINIIINLNLGEERDIDFVFDLLKKYLKENPNLNGEIWYHDKFREWGDYYKVCEWKRLKNNDNDKVR